MKTLTIGDLKARIPIIQGGMGVGISLSGLASAVANEGGIGVISAAGLGLLYKKLSPSNYTEAGNLGLAEVIKSAPKAGPAILLTDCNAWFTPAIRINSDSGANMGIAACIAGEWKAFPILRRAINK